MKKSSLNACLGVVVTVGMVLVSLGADHVKYKGTQGPGLGRHVVFLAGDEEYRSEEALVQMAQILAVRHGFSCTVLFALNENDGTINPDNSRHLSNPAALDSADLVMMSLRFREYPDEVMKHFVDAHLRGIPFVGLRTSTHAFKYSANSTSPYARYSFRSKEWPGGFGRQVLGETWVSHLGANHKEGTLAFPVPDQASHPVLSGVGNIFAYSGAYTAKPMDDSLILMRANVLSGMKPDAPAIEAKSNPPQPVAWVREHANPVGKTNRVFCTTMGAGPDLRDENMRRLLVNAVYWGLSMEVPANADVRFVTDFNPTDYSFKGFKKGVIPASLALPDSAFDRP